MTTTLTILTDGFADWETALLNAVARSYYEVDTRFATPGGTSVTSSGGLQVTPDLAVENVDLEAFDAVIVCGGTIWQTPAAPDLTTLLISAHEKGKVVGAICDATVAAARTGLLNRVKHTSNGAGYLDGTGYGGAALYQDTPSAVVDARVVTAPATAPVSFMAAIMHALGLADANLDFYVGMHAAEHQVAQAT